MIHRVNPGNYRPSMGAGKRASAAAAEKDRNVREVRDVFGMETFTAEDMTSDGKVPIILKGTSKLSLSRMKGIIKRKFNPDQANIREDLPLVDGVKIEVDPGNFRKLMKALPKTSQVILDSKIFRNRPEKIIPRTPDMKDEKPRSTLDIKNSTLGVNRLWEAGYTGKGVGICVIDSGIHPHPDFEDRIVAFADMAEGKNKPYDPYGHGTHVAGIAAGSGKASKGKFRGVAPDADIVGVRITSVSEAIKGLQWAIENKEEYNIKVINMSLGDYPMKSYKNDPWAQAAEKAWEKGIAVVVAAGNEGPDPGTISTPGTAPSVITVGAMDDKNTAAREDDRMSNFSSRGPTSPDGLEKPDVVAPGVEIFGPLAPDSTIDTPDRTRVDDKYIADSGSSMSTPLVSGLAALLLQANPELSNDELKIILMKTAEVYLPRVDNNDQGAGLIDPMESLQVALGKKKISSDAKKEEVPMLISEKNKARRSKNKTKKA